MQAPARLRHWLDLIHTPDADELMVRDAWSEIEPGELLQELGRALIAPERERLLRLWQDVQQDEAREFLRYLYTHTRDFRGSTPDTRIDADRIYQSLLGMVSGALAVRAALERDRDGIREWGYATAAAWNAMPIVGTLSEPTTGAASPEQWLDSSLLSLWRSDTDRWRMGAVRAWTQALFRVSCEERQRITGETIRLEFSPITILDQRRLPLLIYLRGGRGLVGWLYLEVVGGGTGDFYASPEWMGLFPATRGFLEATQIAWEAALAVSPERALSFPDTGGVDVRWRLASNEIVREDNAVLEGGSHGAAMGIGLTQLLRGDLVDSSYAVTATLNAQGAWGPVAGVREKAVAAFGLQDENGYPLISRLVAHPDNAKEAREAALNAGRDPARSVFTASSLLEYLPEASGIPEQMRLLLHGERRWIREDAGQQLGRDFEDWSQLERVCIPVRVARGLHPQGRYSGREDMPEGQRASMVVEWQQIRADFTRAVVLGAPGYGKTTLLWWEVGKRCGMALEEIEKRPERAHTQPLAVFLRAVELTEALINAGAAANTALSVIASLLTDRHRLKESLREFLGEKIRRGECLVALDALDEVPVESRPVLDRALNALAQQHPSAKLLVTARREGYLRSSLPFTEGEELEIRPFDDMQIRQAIHAWFDHAPQAGDELYQTIQARGNLRYVLRSPLLLRLACRVAADEWKKSRTLPRWDRRVELYQMFLTDMIHQWGVKAHPSIAQRDLFLDFAADVALEYMRQSRGKGVDRGSGMAEIVNRVQPNYPVMTGRMLLDDLCSAGILMSEGADRLHSSLLFTHRSFAEFLAARSLARLAREHGWIWIESEVDACANLSEWQEVIIFLAGLLDDPVPLLAFLSDPAKDDLFRHRLALAALCLPEVELG